MVFPALTTTKPGTASTEPSTGPVRQSSQLIMPVFGSNARRLPGHCCPPIVVKLPPTYNADPSKALEAILAFVAGAGPPTEMLVFHSAPAPMLARSRA